MPLSDAVRKILAEARLALKPQSAPGRTLSATAKQDLRAALLVEVSETVLPRMLSFTAAGGRRLDIVAGNQLVYQVSSGKGIPAVEFDRIAAALREFAEGVSSASVTSAPLPKSIELSDGGHEAGALLAEPPKALVVDEPRKPPPADPGDPTTLLRAQADKLLRGFAVVEGKRAPRIDLDDPGLALAEIARSAAEDTGQQSTFLDAAIPGQKLVFLSGRAREAPAIAFGRLDDRVVCASFATENLAEMLSAWQSLITQSSERD